MMKNNTFFRTLKTGMTVFPGEFLLMFIVSLFNAALPVLGIYLTSNLFSTVQILYSIQQKQFLNTSFLLYLLLYALFLVLSFSYSVLYNRYYVQFNSLLKFEQKMKNILHEKCGQISNENFENPAIYNYVVQAQNASINIYRTIEICISVFAGISSTILVSLYVSQFNPLLISFIILALLPPVIETVSDTQKKVRFLNKKTQLMKEEKAYADAITDLKAAKETKFLNLTGFFIGKWQGSHERRVRTEDTMSRRLLTLRLFLSPLKIAGDCSGFLISLYLLSTGSIDFGQFSASLMAYQLLKKNYVELFSLFGYFNQFIQFVKPFFRFMDLSERCSEKNEQVTIETEIELKDCCFTYPTSKDDVLKNINLTIKKGETIAIVGYNGSGKTTLTQLIMGLYLPESGQVLYDGCDISKIKQELLFQRSSCVFQNFNRYYFTLGENVAISDFEKYNGEKMAALIAQNFPENENLTADTLIGKLFGGRELSGGQWQRISIMRAFFKESELIVLDEPTSAIDPFSESRLYEEFRRLLQNKTGVIVTHKLGSIKLADRIVVLKDGEIIEQGTHKALLEKDGIYAQLWDSQIKTYAVNSQGEPDWDSQL